MAMDEHALELAATEKTPSVRLEPGHGRLTIAGTSIPENADRFYSPIFDAVDRYCLGPAPRTTVRVSLRYFNTSTAKYLLDLLKRLEDIHASGASKVQLEWCHAPGDLDMAETGRDYKALLDFPVKLVEEGL